jgi:hypothetical protein
VVVTRPGIPAEPVDVKPYYYYWFHCSDPFSNPSRTIGGEPPFELPGGAKNVKEGVDLLLSLRFKYEVQQE